MLDYDIYHNGGEWLDSVFQSDLERGLTGFVHAEDHYWVEGQGLTGHGKAYKSISLGKNVSHLSPLTSHLSPLTSHLLPFSLQL